MIELVDGRYYIGFWFCDGGDRDWMACAWRETDRWVLKHRWRYYNSPDPFDPNDRKSWHSCFALRSKKTEEDIIRDVEKLGRTIAGLVFRNPGGFSACLIRSDDLDKVMFEMAKMDWAHIKRQRASKNRRRTR